MSIVNFRIKNCGDFEFRFVVDSNRWGWRLKPIRYWVRMCWFQHRDVKNWVNGPKAVWESECNGMAARSCKDLIWPEELI